MAARDSSLPKTVSDSEKLARAIFEPFHIKKGKVKSAAFKAPAGKKDVSVNRLRALSPDDCKKKAKEIEKPGKVYQGFAVITAEEVRTLGSKVVDSREPPPRYFGHADIIHDVVLKKNEPAPAEFNHRLQKMANQARYYRDPDPGGDGWNGTDFSHSE